MNLFSRDDVSRRLWQVAEHDITAEMICCDPLEPDHDLCARGYTALDVAKELFVDNPDSYKTAPVLDAVMRLLSAQTRLDRTVGPPDATTILAARHLDATEGPVQVGRYVDQSTRFAIDQVLRYIAQVHNASSAPVGMCELPHQSTEEEEQCEKRRLAECSASLSGNCLREGHGEQACNTEAEECVMGGKPADSPALQRLKAAAHDATEAAHVHAMQGMKRVFELCRDSGGLPIQPSEVLAALGLDENANIVQWSTPAAETTPKTKGWGGVRGE
jgi:hypothetical protein